MFTRPIGVFFGSTTGNTEDAALTIARALCDRTNGPDVRTTNICGLPPEKLLPFDFLVLGCPTWDEGQLQSDWEVLLSRLGDARFDGKKVALFGSGDAAGYDFISSKAVEDGRFLGLALDIDDTGATIRQKVAHWAEQILEEFAAG